MLVQCSSEFFVTLLIDTDEDCLVQSKRMATTYIIFFWYCQQQLFSYNWHRLVFTDIYIYIYMCVCVCVCIQNIHMYIYIYMYISKEMRLVILLPITGEKLLLTIPEKYYIFSCHTFRLYQTFHFSAVLSLFFKS